MKGRLVTMMLVVAMGTGLAHPTLAAASESDYRYWRDLLVGELYSAYDMWPEIAGPEGPESMDWDADGIPDLWMIHLAAWALGTPSCSWHQAALDAYTHNLAAFWSTDPGSDEAAHIEYFTVVSLMSTTMRAVGAAIGEAWGGWPPGFDPLVEFWVLSAKSNEPLHGSGDFDGDGVTNYQEYSNICGQGGNVEDFVAAARDSSRDGSEPMADVWRDLLVGQLYSAYDMWPEIAGPEEPESMDWDADGIPDLWMIHLAAWALGTPSCSWHQAALDAYTHNLAAFWSTDPGSDEAAHIEYFTVVSLMNTTMRAVVAAIGEAWGNWPPEFDPLVEFWVLSAKSNEPLHGAGDFDGDGVTNYQEYSNICGQGGNVEDFVAAARDSNRDGSEPMPAVGTASLGLLVLLVAGLGVLFSRWCPR